jgi:hypothetical protein
MYAIIDSIMVVKGTVIALSGMLFFLLVGLYFATVKYIVYRYKKKYNMTPVFNGPFKLYSKSLLSNVPSQKEKDLYIATNKLTVVFNSLIVASVFAFVILSFCI